LYRARNPRSWWWTPEIEFHAKELHALQGANWQRSKSKKDPPKPITRPKETRVSKVSAEDQRKRKQKFKEMRKAVS
jgi:hypothetical protein